MAEFKGGDVVVVPMPTAPEMVVWALPGPVGDIPYAEVENLVDAEFDDRIGTMTTLESSTVQASEAAATAAGTASTAASEAVTARGEAVAAAGTASTASGTAVSAAGTATEAAGIAEQYALEFDLDVTSATGAPGSQASVTVTGDGPAYQINLVIPEGAKGAKGDDGQITQEELDTAIASLVDNAPEALDTLTELAAALGNDPNFATTTATEIGKRVLIDGAPEEYNTLGKLVTALQAMEIGGSTDASVLEGPLTDQVDVSNAMVSMMNMETGELYGEPGPAAAGFTMGIEAYSALPMVQHYLYTVVDEYTGEVAHQHDGADITGALTEQVDLTDANVTMPADGYPDGLAMQMGMVAGIVVDTANSLDSKANSSDLEDKIQLVTEFPASPTPGVLYVTEE